MRTRTVILLAAMGSRGVLRVLGFWILVMVFLFILFGW
jgi:hypothetical protein